MRSHRLATKFQKQYQITFLCYKSFEYHFIDKPDAKSYQIKKKVQLDVFFFLPLHINIKQWLLTLYILNFTVEQPIFNLSDWLGKVYPVADVPPELEAFHQSALKIPPVHHAQLRPECTLSVSLYLSKQLPQTCADLITYNTIQCFLKVPPLQDLMCLQTFDIPSKVFIICAKDHLEQALLDGLTLISDPSYKGSNPLPLWILEYCTILTVGSQGVMHYMHELTVTQFRIWWYVLQ